MIKNIVFDLGNVLATFDPHSFLHALFSDKDREDVLYSILFVEHDWWHQYDYGLLMANDIIDLVEDAYKEDVRLVMKEWVNYVIPIDTSIDVLNKYKDTYNLYILSNIPEDCYNHFFTEYDVQSYVKGGVYSFEERMGKPDKRIYEILINRYHLNPKETLFIDDRVENIVSAEKLGFEVIHLKNPKELNYRIEERL